MSAAGGAAPWRLLVGPSGDGAANMAIDEAILETYDASADPCVPTLRLYGWSPAALSLGRAQRAEGAHDPEALRRLGIDLVRRPTGGTAVLHDAERTYAVVGRLGVPPFTGGVVATYRAIAEAVASGLRRMGLAAEAVAPVSRAPRVPEAACFARTGAWEIESSGRKLVGAAQARRRGAFLQHGSIPKRLDASRLGAVLGARVESARFTDLAEAAGRGLDDDAIDRSLIAGFEEAFETQMVASSLSEHEALRAAELRCWKYDSVAWTAHGTIGEREARWGPVVRR